MFCTHCGATLPEGSRFCTSCGQPVVTPVPRQEAGPSQTVVAPAGAQPTPMSAQPTTYLDQGLTTPVSPEPITEPLFPECGDEEPAQMASQPTVAYPHFNQGGAQQAYDAGVQQTYQAPAQPAYQSVPQQPAYDYGQNSVGQTPQKGMSRGTLAAVIAAIVLVAAAAAVFIVLDPLGVIAPKHEAPATSVAAESQPAQSKPAKTAPATQPAATDAATTQSVTPASGDYILPDVQTRVYSTAELEQLSTDELWYARNEIFARHGRGFRNPELQSYFNSKPWYTRNPIDPDTFDSTVTLSATEQQNADAIKAIEQARGSSNL
ncbi:MAG: YARHG domain-containing protein [Parolsenella sp.]|uniref:YARHG domain-containing protein n=1 Tax=Parolsenella sp. TaxID=2083006 RepID=UPI002E77CF26|nr:YARHG domain-containing protein [Parolsenella sp.]MEE1373124.1 YARHG domain-containing protein [Parolsenella sp.]